MSKTFQVLTRRFSSVVTEYTITIVRASSDGRHSQPLNVEHIHCAHSARIADEVRAYMATVVDNRTVATCTPYRSSEGFPLGSG